MKNLFILPTNKPSRLANRDSNNKLEVSEKNTLFVNGFGFTPQNIYITSDEEIKKGDWCLYNKNHNSRNQDWILIKCGKIESEEMHPISEGKLLLWMIKIILTTDQDLIKDGIQPVPDDFLDWFVKNPSCESVEVKPKLSYIDGKYIDSLKIIIPSEEPNIIDQWLEKNDNSEIDKQVEEEAEELCKKETLEEAAKKYAKGLDKNSKEDFINGGNWVKERSYSEEEVKNIISNLARDCYYMQEPNQNIAKWFEQFKKK